MQTPSYRLAGGLDLEATVRIDQLGAVEDGKRAEIHRPAELIGPKIHQILRRQAFHEYQVVFIDGDVSCGHHPHLPIIAEG